ncbi:MAG TPA: winged helix-turn-helix domain-containing protein, partial [Dongiaceae bacterium]|nr:winged helix-turn-helix domain-containing protein [Dongiaceae bacterium]
MTQSVFIHFADCEIDVAGFVLRRRGEVCDVEPQVLELLLHLARNPDRLLTKDDLIQHVWHGRIVSDTTVTSRIKSARAAIGDDGTQQKLIRTVHGRGVRFIGEVRIGTRRASDGDAGTPRSIAGAAAAQASEARAAEESAWPAIAVLPFTNIGGDKDQDYFADGVTEDIITDLSRFRELRVVARDSCFQHRTPGADLQQIGRALAADFVVTGSIRRRGAKLRLSAQLTATDSGNQLWAERFDRGAEDLFAMADELVRTIVGTLVGRVRGAGSALAKRKAPANLAAYECVLRGQAAQAQIGDSEQEAAARHFFERALASDPDYPRAHAGLAVVLLCEWFRAPDDGAEDTDAILDRALEHAERAVAIDNDDYECHETLGWIL